MISLPCSKFQLLLNDCSLLTNEGMHRRIRANALPRIVSDSEKFFTLSENNFPRNGVAWCHCIRPTRGPGPRIRRFALLIFFEPLTRAMSDASTTRNSTWKYAQILVWVFWVRKGYYLKLFSVSKNSRPYIWIGRDLAYGKIIQLNIARLSSRSKSLSSSGPLSVTQRHRGRWCHLSHGVSRLRFGRLTLDVRLISPCANSSDFI